eukprot:5322785-Prymnesium_polylepis.1
MRVRVRIVEAARPRHRVLEAQHVPAGQVAVGRDDLAAAAVELALLALALLGLLCRLVAADVALRPAVRDLQI